MLSVSKKLVSCVPDMFSLDFVEVFVKLDVKKKILSSSNGSFPKLS